MQSAEDEAEGGIQQVCDQVRIPRATPQIEHYVTHPLSEKIDLNHDDKAIHE